MIEIGPRYASDLLRELLTTKRGWTSHMAAGTEVEVSGEIAGTEGERHCALASEKQATDGG
jgi:hypothetical protein